MLETIYDYVWRMLLVLGFCRANLNVRVAVFKKGQADNVALIRY